MTQHNDGSMTTKQRVYAALLLISLLLFTGTTIIGQCIELFFGSILCVFGSSVLLVNDLGKH